MILRVQLTDSAVLTVRHDAIVGVLQAGDDSELLLQGGFAVPIAAGFVAAALQQWKDTGTIPDLFWQGGQGNP